MSISESDDDVSTEPSDEVNSDQDIDNKTKRDLLKLSLSGPSKYPYDSESTINSMDHESLIIGLTDTNATIAEKLHERRNYSNIIKEMKSEIYNDVGIDDNIQETLDQFLADRLEMYYIAEENERIIGNKTKVKYLNEGIKTLKKLITRNIAGEMISFDSIPSEIEVSRKSNINPTVSFKTSSEVFSFGSDSDSDDSKSNRLSILSLLSKRRDQYRKVAMQHRRAGNISRAHENLKIANKFESVKNAMELGEAIDLKNLPGPPVNIMYNINSDGSTVQEYRNQVNDQTVENQNQIEEHSSEEQLVTHGSILKTLQERLKFYEMEQDFAVLEGNEVKALKIGFEIKKYANAIRLYEAGKPIIFQELPTPPGHAPLLNIQADSNTQSSQPSQSLNK